MTKRFAVVLTSLTLISAGLLAAPALSETKLKKKAGYWTECTFDGRCETIYMRPKGGGKFRRVKTDGSKLKTKSGYVVECQYSGLGEVCSYVYARPKPGAKFRRVKADAAQ
jgi:azurin